jgi:SAM-dependent methyltransferase
VLDIGCGTGNLSFAVLRSAPGALVTGLDPDASALRTAARKARRRRVGLTLVRGYADRLPVDDASLDHAVSSLALHHVPAEQKESMAAELWRAVRPGGWVTVADFDGAHGSDHGHGGRGHAHGHGHGHDGGHGRDRMGYREDNADGGISRLLTAAGFVEAREVERTSLMRAPVLFVRARRP